MGSSGKRTDFLEAAVRTMLSMILGFALRAGRAFYSDKSDKRESSEKCEVEGSSMLGILMFSRVINPLEEFDRL